MPGAGHLRLSRHLGLLFLLLALAGCGHSGEYHSMQGPTMGTTWNLTYRQDSAANPPQAVHKAVAALLDRLNAEFSTYTEHSEVSAFNRAPPNVWVPVSRDVITVAKKAVELSRQTGGAFDMTITPVLDLWGFGPGGDPTHIPSKTRLDAARKLVDYRAIDLRDDPPALRKRKAGMRINFNALVAGFAADQAADLLQAKGIHDFLVNMGGELRVAGKNPDGKRWRVAVEKPQSGPRKVERVLKLTNIGLSTSGDYRNFFLYKGKRYSHEFNALTGWPIPQQVASVTVVTPSGMDADGYATALLAVGPDKGLALAEKLGIAALFILRDGSDGWREEPTPAFAKLEQSS